MCRCYHGHGRCGMNTTVMAAALDPTEPIVRLLSTRPQCPEVSLQPRSLHDELPDCQYRYANVTQFPDTIPGSRQYTNDTTVSTWCNGIWDQDYTDNRSDTINWQCTLPCARRLKTFRTGCASTLFFQQHAHSIVNSRQNFAHFLDQVRAWFVLL
eukprot:SAG31_NODE_8837_length_1377_cov_2.387534_2_plen_155_part_00